MEVPVNSVIIGEHSEDCWAKKGKEEGQYPTEWNVMADFKILTTDKAGHEVNLEEVGHAYLFLEFPCADDNCPAKKRISLTALGNISNETFTKEKVLRIVADFAKSWNTSAFIDGSETMESLVSEIEKDNMINWEA